MEEQNEKKLQIVRNESQQTPKSWISIAKRIPKYKSRNAAVQTNCTRTKEKETNAKTKPKTG